MCPLLESSQTKIARSSFNMVISNNEKAYYPYSDLTGQNVLFMTTDL
jgi:hypothetical protein